MNEQVGWRALVRRLKDEAPHYAKLLPELPRLMHQRLSAPPAGDERTLLKAILREQRRTNWLLSAVLWGVMGFLFGVVVTRLVTQIMGGG
jgi:ubiquinone biosynthesis protein